MLTLRENLGASHHLANAAAAAYSYLVSLSDVPSASTSKPYTAGDPRASLHPYNVASTSPPAGPHTMTNISNRLASSALVLASANMMSACGGTGTGTGTKPGPNRPWNGMAA